MSSICVSLFQNYQLYKIERIDAGKRPVLYKLKDLFDAPIPGYYYRMQLTKAEAPTPLTFFRIEKVLEKEERNGRTFCLVKYTHYPAKFNRWVAEDEILK